MILELLEFVSVIGERGGEFLCKFCYGDEDLNGWLRPCKCSGTLKWVHRSCFDMWMKKAPAEQQIQCQTCRYVYSKSWALKPFSQWNLPSLNLSYISMFEILLDTYSIYRFLKGLSATLSGKRNPITQICHFIFLRLFICTDRRLAYYRSLGMIVLSSVFEIRIRDYKTDAELLSESRSVSSATLQFDGAPDVQAVVLPNMEFVEMVVTSVQSTFDKHKERLLTFFVGICLPLMAMTVMMAWKMHQAKIKKNKQIRNKEKVLRLLKQGGKIVDPKANGSKTVVSSSSNGHQKLE